MEFTQRMGAFVSETHTTAAEWCFTIEQIYHQKDTKYQQAMICEILVLAKLCSWISKSKAAFWTSSSSMSACHNRQ